MEKEFDTREGLKKDLEDYIETRLEVLKLKAIEKSGVVAGSVATGLSAAFLFHFFLLFLSFAAAFALSELFDSNTLGFCAVALFYGILATIIVVFREKLITFPIINTLLNKFYYKQAKEE